MKSIPTVYKGIAFRSRLEATWAAYFDALELAWSYEQEGYRLQRDIGYLPDFHLFQPHYEHELFVECKPPSNESVRKAGIFVMESGRTLVLALPAGRFFLGPRRYAKLLVNNDWTAIVHYTRSLPSLAMVGNDAVGGPYNYFWNGGEESDCYVGQAPDYCDTMKDRTRADGGDARTDYYGGYSTWQQRGFNPPPEI